MQNQTTPTMTPTRIQANAQTQPDIIHAEAVDVNWIEAAGDGEAANKLPVFDMLLYTGGLLYLSGWYYPVVVELTGIKQVSAQLPALREHDRTKLVGHCEKVSIDATGIHINGVISGAGADAVEVRTTSKNGVKWQASMGAIPVRKELVEAGKSVTVNGKEFTGPLYVSRETELLEASFVVIGADRTTSASVAAAAPQNEESTMKFEEWLQKTYGMQASALTAEQRTKFEGIFASGSASDGLTPPAPAMQSSAPAAGGIQAAASLTMDEIRAEAVRTEQIRACCKDHPEICAQAIREGWGTEKAELHAMKASAAAVAASSGVTGAPMLNCGASNVAGAELVEAATVGLSLRCGVPESEIKASDKIMSAGYQCRNKSLAEVCAMALMAEGQSVSFGMSKEELFRAAASTKSLSSISRTVSSRALLKGWNSGKPSWREWASIGNLPDFKLTERIALYSALNLKELAEDGRIQDGTLSGSKETYRATRYARGINIDEQTIMNDDLSILSTLPERIGQKSLQKVSNLAYTHLLSNPVMRDAKALFHADHDNLLTGAALSVDTVASAIAALRLMKDEDGEPLDIEPFAIMVPPELENLAHSIVDSPAIIINSAAKVGTSNVLAGYKLKVIVDPRLSTSTYTGSSKTSWYLIGGPAQGETVEVGFVNGVQNPVVEQMPTAPNQYGIYLRTKLDVGVKALDWRGMILNQA